MTWLLIDPLLITVPEVESSDEEVSAWWQSVSLWWQSLSEIGIHWYHDRASTDELMVIGRYANFTTLKELLRHGHRFVNPGASGRINRLIQSDGSQLNAKLITQDALCEGPIVIDPDGFISRNAESVRGKLELALTRVAADHTIRGEETGPCKIVTTGMEHATHLSIRATILITHPEEILASIPGGIVDFTAELMFAPNDLAALHPFEILRSGPEEFIRHIYRIAAALSPNERVECRLHDEFWSSIFSSSIATDPTGMRNLFRTCGEIAANIVWGVAGSRPEPIRVSLGGNSAQRVREKDRAEAWRVTVTKKGVGWRLNFWLCPGMEPNHPRTVEIAWVNKKNEDVYIPE